MFDKIKKLFKKDKKEAEEPEQPTLADFNHDYNAPVDMEARMKKGFCKDCYSCIRPCGARRR